MSDINLDPTDPNLLAQIAELFPSTGGGPGGLPGLLSPGPDYDGLVEWLSENESQLDINLFWDVVEYIERETPVEADLTGKAKTRYEALHKEGGPTQTADARLAFGPGANWDLDASGNIDADERALKESALTRQAEALAGESGNPVAAEKAALETRLGEGPIPEILTTYMGRLIVYGDDPDFDLRVQELIETWNTYNPDRQVTDRAGLFGVLGNTNDPDVKNVMDAVFLGEDPVVDYKITLADGRTVNISAQEFDAFQAAGFGREGVLDRGTLATLVRSADRIGLKNNNGDNGWQIISTLMRSFDLDPGKAEPKERKGGANRGRGSVDVDVAGQRRRGLAAAEFDRVGRLFEQGRYLYGGNESLAFVHATDPTLAAVWANTPSKLTDVQSARIRQLFNDSGYDSATLSAMGYEVVAMDYSALTDPQSSRSRGGGGGGGRQRPDPVAVRQAARDMWMNLYASEPSEQQLNDLIATVDSSITNAPSSQSVSVEAQIRKGLEANPQYQELYGNRPTGMSEQEYQTQFRQGAASLLGSQAADPESIRSGLRSGQYQTTLGRVAGSKQAWGNSTFRGRLAQAAALVSEST